MYRVPTWWERTEERVAEEGAGESAGGVSDQVSRSAVEVCGFLTGVLLSIPIPTFPIPKQQHSLLFSITLTNQQPEKRGRKKEGKRGRGEEETCLLLRAEVVMLISCPAQKWRRWPPDLEDSFWRWEETMDFIYEKMGKNKESRESEDTGPVQVEEAV